MQRVRKNTATTIMTPVRNATPSMMKRVGGGYVMRDPATNTTSGVQPRQRTRAATGAALVSPRTNSTTSSARQVSPTRSGTTSPVARVGRGTATATSPNTRASPRMMRVGGGYIMHTDLAAPSGPRTPAPSTPTPVSITRTEAPVAARPRLTASSTLTRGLVTREAPSMDTQPRLTEVARLKKANAQLSRALMEKTNQLQRAVNKNEKLKTDMDELEKRLEINRQRNVTSRNKLDDLMKIREEDQVKWQQLVEEHNMVKLDLVNSNSMLQDLKVFIGLQERQLEKMKQRSGAKTMVSVEVQTAGTDIERSSTERLFELQHEEHQAKMESLLKNNMELKTEVDKSRLMLEDFREFMKDQLAFLDTIKAGATGTEAAGDSKCEQGAQLYGHQSHRENDPITSLRMQVYMLELKLKDSEYNNELLQMQLDRLPSGNLNSLEKRDFVPDWNTSNLEYQPRSASETSDTYMQYSIISESEVPWTSDASMQ
ncbi:unnamed protein product [Albugo candida]|uniref:Uncharacterized protein n=1 Tax=Albugo candida TaxID=65357 RepID=A0A024GMT3_9STRA|nr:unnamed protein product [Albugo candida]|eukprot:CCI47834.1 unnamed protein product [Albugo candida]